MSMSGNYVNAVYFPSKSFGAKDSPAFSFIRRVNMPVEDLAVLIGIGLKISNIEALEFINEYSKYVGHRVFSFPFTQEELEGFVYLDTLKGLDLNIHKEYDNLEQHEVIRKEYFRNQKIDKII